MSSFRSPVWIVEIAACKPLQSLMSLKFFKFMQWTIRLMLELKSIEMLWASCDWVFCFLSFVIWLASFFVKVSWFIDFCGYLSTSGTMFELYVCSCQCSRWTLPCRCSIWILLVDVLRAHLEIWQKSIVKLHFILVNLVLEGIDSHVELIIPLESHESFLALYLIHHFLAISAFLLRRHEHLSLLKAWLFELFLHTSDTGTRITNSSTFLASWHLSCKLLDRHLLLHRRCSLI